MAHYYIHGIKFSVTMCEDWCEVNIEVVTSRRQQFGMNGTKSDVLKYLTDKRDSARGMAKRLVDLAIDNIRKTLP